MHDWNTIINVNEGGFKRAFRILADFGPVAKTEFFNVLVLRAEDIPSMLEALRERLDRDPAGLAFLSRLIPLKETFIFQSVEEFEQKAKESVIRLAPAVAGKSFYVRIRRRGFKGRISSPEEERLLDAALLDELGKRGLPAEVSFHDPDAVIAVETVGTRAGISLFTREELKRYPFIKLD